MTRISNKYYVDILCIVVGAILQLFIGQSTIQQLLKYILHLDFLERLHRFNE